MHLSVVLLLSCLVTVFGYGPVATWYCSLSNPGTYSNCFPGSCGTYSSINGHGIVALNPMLYTNSSTCHYKGDSCGRCWSLTGPAGSATVAVTDCCAGYPNAPSCVTNPVSGCDWCADNNHDHFDLDRDSFTAVCGSEGLNAGHCDLTNIKQVGC